MQNSFSDYSGLTKQHKDVKAQKIIQNQTKDRWWIEALTRGAKDLKPLVFCLFEWAGDDEVSECRPDAFTSNVSKIK